MPTALSSRRKAEAANLDSPLPAKKTRRSEPKSALAALVPSDQNAAKRPVAAINGSKHARGAQVDESQAVVGHADVDMQDATPEVVTISSGEEEMSDLSSSDDDQDQDAADTKAGATDVAVQNGHDDDQADNEPPSFGELLQANAPEIVDVEATFEDSNAPSRALAPTNNNRALSAPSATSLSTVLTQALKTNDRELLESCFEMNDLDSVRATIERLPSPLVANLLRKLAERLHKRPGRAGNLMVWVQWSIVSHGGYLAGRQEVMRQLTSLNRVIKERASGLQPLLTLKGKLDMLSAQLELRKNMQRSAATNDLEDEEGVIYVEGEDDESDGDEVAGAITDGRGPKDYDELDGAESSDDGAMHFNAEAEDGSEASEDEDVLDDEAEETENDSGDEESEDDLEEDVDDGEDVSGSEVETPRPTKRSAAAQRMGFGSGRRRQ
ncbi:Dip2/Utp12 family-domain-containing protein [Phyllosticta citrichinensis]|uniref:Dip2/Utp12 family-domain-containing protein n=1 Tax=Phyllosticta citrichinensis TaxID=1130410 RepID=A0ABR1Y1C9_9PEZI